jgi:hypothetical protein
MTTEDPFSPTEQRRQARLERLGELDPACVVCGDDDDRALQRHHLAGQAYGEELATVCANCHYKLSDAQADHPSDGPPAPLLVRLAHYLLGLADFACEVAAKLRDSARELLNAAKSCPAPWGLLNTSEES